MALHIYTRYSVMVHYQIILRLNSLLNYLYCTFQSKKGVTVSPSLRTRDLEQCICKWQINELKWLTKHFTMTHKMGTNQITCITTRQTMIGQERSEGCPQGTLKLIFLTATCTKFVSAWRGGKRCSFSTAVWQQQARRRPKERLQQPAPLRDRVRVKEDDN